jgi:hypothetical protein
MGGAADEDHAALVPAVGLHPLDRAGVELLVAFQGVEVGRDRLTASPRTVEWMPSAPTTRS